MFFDFLYQERGNWAPQIPRNLILCYSKPRDLALDQMCGCGTTLIECKLTGRNAIGFDINPEMVEVAEKSLKFDLGDDIPRVDIEVNVREEKYISIAKKKIRKALKWTVSFVA